MRKIYKIVNLSNNAILAEKALRTRNMHERTKGLLGRNSLAQDEALIIEPAGSIHTFFMKFAIGLLFIDGNGKVLKAIDQVKPNKLVFAPFKTKAVIELASGVISANHVQDSHIISINAVQTK